MSSFDQFAARCKMRHDFGDQIQVRFFHSNGESYDTWISGEEVLRRLRSTAREQRLRGLGRVRREDVEAVGDEISQEARRRLDERLRDELGDRVEALLGGNVIGSSVAEAARGGKTEEENSEKERWQPHLQDKAFRAVALELAWINLRGSFPPLETGKDENGWV